MKKVCLLLLLSAISLASAGCGGGIQGGPPDLSKPAPVEPPAEGFVAPNAPPPAK